MKTPSRIDIAQKFSLFSEKWSPRVVAELNDYQVKLARLEGEFVWHRHDDTDELFYIVAGELVIEFRDHSERLSAGEMLVVPKGVEHRPVAAAECQVMIIEPRGVVNTGDAGGDRTAPNDVWI
jgi:mannose-6-phosphate isomerase-like protein (cupin superfamily)